MAQRVKSTGKVFKTAEKCLGRDACMYTEHRYAKYPASYTQVGLRYASRKAGK